MPEQNSRNSRLKIWIPVFLAFLGLAIGGVKWGAQLDARVDYTEEWISENKRFCDQAEDAEKWIDRNRETIERTMPKLEERVDQILRAIQRIEDKVEQIGRDERSRTPVYP